MPGNLQDVLRSTWIRTGKPLNTGIRRAGLDQFDTYGVGSRNTALQNARCWEPSQRRMSRNRVDKRARVGMTSEQSDYDSDAARADFELLMRDGNLSTQNSSSSGVEASKTRNSYYLRGPD